MVELDCQLKLNNEIIFVDSSSFKLASGSHLTLGPSAEIVGESNINTIKWGKWNYMVTTKNHTAGVTNAFGLIGVQVSNGATSMGSTDVLRRYGTFDIIGHIR